MAEQTESNWTESRFRQRLVGASVVVALAVLLLPLWLDGSGIDSLRVQSVPEKPEVEGAERIEIPQPPGDSGEPLENPPQSLFPDQTPIEARPEGESETMTEAVIELAEEPAASDEAETDIDTSPPDATSEQVPAEAAADAAEPASQPDAGRQPEAGGGAGERAQTDAAADEGLPRSASDGEFVVQLGSFSDERNAQALAESVEASGFEVFVTPLFSEQGTVWRVRVGPYATRELAGEATERLRQRIGRDGLVMTK